MKMPIILSKNQITARLQGESGRVGYIIAWLFGVPAWLLLMVFLIRGH